MSKGKPVSAPKAGEKWSSSNQCLFLADWFMKTDQGANKWCIKSIAKRLGRSVDSVETLKNKLLGYTTKPDSGKAYIHYTPGPTRLPGGEFYREGKGWSERDYDALKRLQKAGRTPGYIAGILARSEKAVLEKIAELQRKKQKTLWEMKREEESPTPNSCAADVSKPHRSVEDPFIVAVKAHDDAKGIHVSIESWPDENGLQPRDMSLGYVKIDGGRVHVQETDWLLFEVNKQGKGKLIAVAESRKILRPSWS